MQNAMRKRKHSKTDAATIEVSKTRKRVQGNGGCKARRGPLFKYFTVVSETPTAKATGAVIAREGDNIRVLDQDVFERGLKDCDDAREGGGDEGNSADPNGSDVCIKGRAGETDSAGKDSLFRSALGCEKSPNSFVSHLHNCQVTGKYSREFVRGCWGRDVKRFEQVAGVDCFPGSRNEAIVDVEFDSMGTLFLVCKLTGELGIVDFDAFKENAQKASQHRHNKMSYSMMNPLLTIHGQYFLQAARWHPTNQNVVASISKCSRQIPIFNLEVYQGEPRLVLETSDDTSGTVGSVSPGFYDMQFMTKRSSTLIAADRGGRVILWDLRSWCRPVASLVSQQQRTGGWPKVVCSLAEGPDGEHTVLGGTDKAEIILWDIRKAGHSLLPPTEIFPIREPREPYVPVGDSLQEAVLHWSVHCIVPYPKDPSNFAFVAVSSKRQWVGGLNLHSGEIIHMCQGEEAGPDFKADRNMREKQKASWLSSSPTLLSGNCFRPTFSAFDFSSSMVCESYHPERDAGHLKLLGNQNMEVYDPPYEARIPTWKRIVCVACHPKQDTIIAGTASSVAILMERPSKA